MHQQRPFGQSMQPDYFRQEQQRNNSQILSNSLHYSEQNNLRNSLKKQSLNEDKTASNPSPNTNSNSILNILKSKLASPQGSNFFKVSTPIKE